MPLFCAFHDPLILISINSPRRPGQGPKQSKKIQALVIIKVDKKKKKTQGESITSVKKKKKEKKEKEKKRTPRKTLATTN